MAVRHRRTDPALAELAPIVRGADADAKDLTPESRGLEAIAEDFRLVYSDDHEQLERELSTMRSTHTADSRSNEPGRTPMRLVEVLARAERERSQCA